MKNKVINLKRFTLDELRLYFMTEGDVYGSDVGYSSNGAPVGIPDNEELSIGDHLRLEIYKGSENLYLDLFAYRGDCVEVKIELYTKEAHDKLKHFIHEIIKQA